MLSHYDDTTITLEPHFGIRYSGCWGWTNPADNRKYAIVGTSRSTKFIEVTNPAQPVLRDEVAGRRDNCIWREYQTYGKYAYMVSDDDFPNSFQIADLSYLPDSVHLVMDSDSIFSRTHTLFIDGDKLYCGSVKTNPAAPDFSSMNVYSLQNPEKPLLLRRLDTDYTLSGNQVHDMQVRNDTIFASCGYDGLYIFTYNKTQNKFHFVSNLSGYPQSGYNHSSTWSKDGKTLVMTDEVPKALPAKVVDVSDISAPFITANFAGTDSATPHNVYFLGDSKICVLSNYEDGIQLYDVYDNETPKRIGYFDTHYQSTPTSNHGNYAGNWGSYVDFGGGLIVANDMQNGFFVLDISAAILGIVSLKPEEFKIWPNPAQDYIYTYPITARSITTWSITDICGKKVETGNQWPSEGLRIANLSTGSYFLNVEAKRESKTFRLVKN